MNFVQFTFENKENFDKAKKLVECYTVKVLHESTKNRAIAIASKAEATFFSLKLESGKIPYTFTVKGDKDESH